MPNVTGNLVITVLVMTRSPVYFDICFASFPDRVTSLLLVSCFLMLPN